MTLTLTISASGSHNKAAKIETPGEPAKILKAGSQDQITLYEGRNYNIFEVDAEDESEKENSGESESDSQAPDANQASSTETDSDKQDDRAV